MAAHSSERLVCLGYFKLLEFQGPSKNPKKKSTVDMFLPGKICDKNLTVWKHLKMLKLPRTFVFVALEG